ncbi:MAG: penicillin-binding protein 2, partial [Fibrella sp.]|nr:penicillin-binding protein 2 [Armatimonadota bacterium]
MATLDTYRYRPGGFPQPRRNTIPPAAVPVRRDMGTPARRRARAVAADRAASSRVNIPRRIGFVCAVVGIAYLGLVGKLASIQVASHDKYVAEAKEMRRKTIRLAAPRGVLLDRNGTLLVQNEPAATIVVDPNLWGADLNKKKGETFESRKANALKHLETLLPGVDVHAEVEKRAGQPVQAASGKIRYRTVDLARRVPVSVGESVKAAIKEHGIIGVGVLPDTVRKATDGNLAPQILGFTGQEGDGLDGLEKILDPKLDGKNGFVTAEFDKARVPIPGTEYKRVDPQAGRDIVLTLDSALQHDVEAALDKVFVSSHAEAAIAVVLDPKTGDVLAMANRPTYNVNHRDPKVIDGRLNRCVSSPYEPGSTLKVMTMAAALEEQLATPNAQFFCGGSMGIGRRTIHCAHGARHGDETATDVIKNSCNIASAQLAFRLGKEKLYDYEKRFGFGEKSGAGFPGESRGILAKADIWSDIQTANIGFGQGISVTPLQLTAAYAAIANGGTYLPPRIVWGMRDQATGDLKPVAPAKGRKVVSPETSRAMLHMLQEVVDHGTGDKARLSSWTAGGKTGTAQIAQNGHYNGKYVASFVGMAPMNDPQFVILVAVTAPKGGYYGGVVAGPVFKEIAEKALMARRVAPDKM